MKTNVGISETQAKRMAQDIRSNHFSVSGTGYFDLTLEDTTELIMICINSKSPKERSKKLGKLYDKLSF
jgi:hypothetical protein